MNHRKLLFMLVPCVCVRVRMHVFVRRQEVNSWWICSWYWQHWHNDSLQSHLTKCFWVETSWNKLQIIFFFSLSSIASKNVNKKRIFPWRACNVILTHTKFPFEPKRDTIWHKWGLNSGKNKAKYTNKRKTRRLESMKQWKRKKNTHNMTTSKDLVKVNSKTIFTANIDSICLLLFSPTNWCKTNQQWNEFDFDDNTGIEITNKIQPYTINTYMWCALFNEKRIFGNSIQNSVQCPINRKKTKEIYNQILTQYQSSVEAWHIKKMPKNQNKLEFSSEYHISLNQSALNSNIPNQRFIRRMCVCVWKWVYDCHWHCDCHNGIVLTSLNR